MAEPVISFVVETLGNLLLDEGKFLIGVKDQARQLHAELKQLRAFLKDADRRQNETDSLRECISQTRDLAYQAENLLEHYAFRIQSLKGRGVTRIIRRCVSLLDECRVRHQVGSDIQSLRANISGLTKSFQEYGVTTIMENEGGSTSRQQEIRRTYSHIIDQEDLVGIESQVEELAKQLNGENYRVVSIIGMGGLGKTTLAKKVYHHPNVKRHFSGFSWVSISQQWQTRNLLLGITVKLMPEKRNLAEKWRDEELVRQLFEFQQNHKSLIVLDDIWSIDAWECIKYAFPINEKGSKLMLTSRKKEVATHIEPNGFLYEPRLLSPEESWELLQRKSMIQRRIEDCDQIQQMEELGKNMVQHCGGLPLAIIALGGILAKRQGMIEWQNVHKNVKSYLGKKKDQEGLDNILELSYSDLPYRLKPCFLYLSKYSEDVEIETESLYQIWMAEGMVSADDKIGEETMMGIAERYLGELVERSMVFVEMEEEMPSRRRFRSVRLHDIVRELCLLKAKEENFLQLINYRGRNNTELVDSSLLTNTHRLAIYLDDVEDEAYVPLIRGAYPHLRSFTNCSKEASHIEKIMKIVMTDFKMLRVLITEYKDYLVAHVPSAIGKCIHLRYWGLLSGGFIIPSSMGKLEHLQTLALNDMVGDIGIPNVIWRLKRLKHLYLPYMFYDPYRSFRKIRLDGLHNLEILENFDSRCTDVKDLSTLTNLRSLSAHVYYKLEDVEEFITGVNNKLNYLRFLSLQIRDCDFGSEKGSTLLREVFSCDPLTYLSIIEGRISKLPEYEPCFLPNLHELKLSFTHIEEDPMRTLEKLPRLRCLSLYLVSFIGEEMICHATGFRQLKSLVLHLLPNLKNWWIEEGAMPNLSTLTIAACGELKMFPSGLRFIRTLKELKIYHMPEEFKRKVQVKDEEGREEEDFNILHHVPSIIIM